jgi:nucleotide-binding universal stress UspA family protein
MYHKILIPLDGSEQAEAILPHAENLASCYGATLIFLQVVEPSVIYASPYGLYPEIDPEQTAVQTEEAQAYLAAVGERFKAKGIANEQRVGSGPVVTAILDLAEKEGADLIAMASHGRTGLGRFFYGSVAAGVLHRIDRPLLLVRSE